MDDPKRNVFTLIMVGGVLLGATLGCNSIKEMANSGQNASPAASPIGTVKPTVAESKPKTAGQPNQTGGLTMSNFERLQKGMTLDEVAEILGSEGVKSGEMGDKETTGFKIEIYKWTEEGSNREITAFFKDTKLDTQFQFGLD